MNDMIKIDFYSEDKFIIYYISDQILRTEEEMKTFFKMLNNELNKRYNYEFHGFYDVTIFCNKNLYILEFRNIDDYGRSDFNITMLLNSVLLYEFEDSDLILGEKIYYKGKYYVEIDDMIDSIYLFEYGKIVYGREIDNILNSGVIIPV